MLSVYCVPRTLPSGLIGLIPLTLRQPYEGGALLLLSSPKPGYGKVQELAQYTQHLKPEGRAPEPILLSSESSASPPHKRAYIHVCSHTGSDRDTGNLQGLRGPRFPSAQPPPPLQTSTPSVSITKDRAGVGASP